MLYIYFNKYFYYLKNNVKINNEEFISLVSGTMLYLQKSRCKSLTEEVLTLD